MLPHVRIWMSGRSKFHPDAEPAVAGADEIQGPGGQLAAVFDFQKDAAAGAGEFSGEAGRAGEHGARAAQAGVPERFEDGMPWLGSDLRSGAVETEDVRKKEDVERVGWSGDGRGGEVTAAAMARKKRRASVQQNPPCGMSTESGAPSTYSSSSHGCPSGRVPWLRQRRM